MRKNKSKKNTDSYELKNSRKKPLTMKQLSPIIPVHKR